jgi:hypothetical protein
MDLGSNATVNNVIIFSFSLSMELRGSFDYIEREVEKFEEDIK